MHILKTRGIIRKDDKIFLSFIPKAGFFCLPGGTMDEGETFKQCIEREIFEELAIKPKVGKVISWHELINSRGELQFELWFEIENIDDFENFDKSCATHGFECSDEGFYSWEEIEKMEVRPKNLREILEKWIGILE